MNSNTKEKLIVFADAVEKLGYAASSIIGKDNLAELITAAEELKLALEKDETIFESR